MRKEGYWVHILIYKLFSSDLMRLRISFYASLDKDASEFSKQSSKNIGKINIKK